MITGKTKLLGVIGHPIEHSLSPVMHNAALAHLGLDYVYLPLPVHPENLQQAIAGFEAIDFQGFNITIPHKQAILPFLSEVSEIAQAVGAVNTVWQTENGWSGTNTDVAGFIAPLQERAQQWDQTIAVVLGNGGAARAVVVGLAQLGCAKIQVVGRDAQKLEAFLTSWQHSPYAKNLQVYPWSELPNLLPAAQLVVNTTPIGMHPHVEDSPLSLEEFDQLAPGSIAYDLIYTPNPTRFLQQAKDRGAIAIDGLEMLVEQGAAALRLWLQQPVPTDVMRRSLQRHLGWIK